ICQITAKKFNGGTPVHRVKVYQSASVWESLVDANSSKRHDHSREAARPGGQSRAVGASPRPRARAEDQAGHGVLLVQQRDAIQTAKLVASIDRVSQGRFLFGVGDLEPG